MASNTQFKKGLNTKVSQCDVVEQGIIKDGYVKREWLNLKVLMEDNSVLNVGIEQDVKGKYKVVECNSITANGHNRKFMSDYTLGRLRSVKKHINYWCNVL